MNVNDGVVTVIVTAADGKTTETYTVKLVKKTVPVESIAIFGDGVAEGKLALETGKSVKLTATVTPTDADDAAVSWSVEGDAVTVDKTGLVKAVKAGTATVTATAGGKTASITVTVTDPVVPPAPSVDSVAITGSEVKDGKLELKVGGEATLTADVTVTGDIAKTVTWTSSDEKIATVDANGNVKAVAEGNATITATSTEDATKSAPVAVTVTKKTTTEPEQPEQPAPAEKDLTDANHVDDLITAESIKPGAKLTLNVGKAFAGKTVNVYAFSNGKAVLVASGVTVSKDGTVVVTVPADLKLGATKFAVQFADDSLVWDAVNVAKPTAEQPKADETANTGAAILGAVALMALLAAAGAALIIWRKRQI